jgi:SAM-dependent methyltransferase
MTPPCSSVDEAIDVLGRLVADQKGGDERYFRGQLARFRLTGHRLQTLCPPPARILDIGSHYLHQSSILSLLGYDVIGVDVPLFSKADFVVERAKRMGITNVSVENLEDGNILPGLGYEGTIDLAIFTAVLEHITFNPVRFWRRIYELLSPNGRIYVTTPNGMRLAAIVRQMGRLIALRGAGLPVDEVLGTITYGHHWKEYSTAEIKEYFRILSPDFSVSARLYQDPAPRMGLKGMLSQYLAVIPWCRDEIEAVVSLSGKTGAFASVPGLPMNAAPPHHAGVE